MAKSFEDLRIWQQGHKLMLEIYEITQGFPKSEAYSLTSQLRRAALSVPANIAESQGRYHDAETVHFLFNARGSAEEVRSLLMAARDIPGIRLEPKVLDELNQNYLSLIKGINRFVSVLREKPINKLTN